MSGARDSGIQDAQARMVEALQDAACYPHVVSQYRHIETHISHLLLTGDFAYKIKKPLDLGFLDFSTLDKRHHYCEEELRLNRRLAPDIYLDVVTINGTPANPRIDGAGQVIEYAVKMRQFDPEETLDRLEEKDQLALHHIDTIANAVADFHAHVASATPESGWGTAEAVWQPVQQNFEQIARNIENSGDEAALLKSLRDWSDRERHRLAPEFEHRRLQGFVRECHGDLHLGNMAWDRGNLLIFDCIEFNPGLRWIDVMSEAAFCYMDLLQRGRREYAARFLNRYLERTGDYDGVKLLRFYTVYRAMVRAKVAYIRSAQPDQDNEARQTETREGLNYLRLADALARPAKPMLVITHGLSGSGKTTFSQKLATQAGMIVLRSDVERKRLAGLDMTSQSGADIDSGIYSLDFSQRTYEYLAKLVDSIIVGGWSILVDATFIARWQRDLFIDLARRCEVALRILEFDAPESILLQRVRARSLAGNDASEADERVLKSQIRTQEPLTKAEQALCITATSVAQVDQALKKSQISL